jgi:hypothetical protein
MAFTSAASFVAIAASAAIAAHCHLDREIHGAQIVGSDEHLPTAVRAAGPARALYEIK